MAGLGPKQIDECRKSRAAFIEAVILDEQGRPVELAPHHRLWLAHIEYCFLKKHLRAGVLGPMGHGKSNLQFGLTLFQIGVDQNVRIKFICGDEPAAKKRLKTVERYITGEQESGKKGEVVALYKQIFPDVLPDANESWNSTELFIQRSGMGTEPTLHAQGIESSGTGGRADLIVYDDCVTFKNAISEPARQPKIIDGFQTQWQTRLEGVNSNAALIGTPYTGSDLHAHLLKTPGWLFLQSRINDDISGIECEVATDDENHPLALCDGAELVKGRWRATLPLWEKRWPRESLIKVRAESRLTFDRCYRCKITTGLSGTFPSVKRALICETPEEYKARPSWVQCVSLGLDPANQSRLGTTLAVMGLVTDEKGGLRRRLLHIERNRLNAPDTMRRACMLHAIWNFDVGVPEVNAYQKAALLPILDEFIKAGKDPALARVAEDLKGKMHEWFTSGANKNTDVIGLEGLEMAFQNHQIVIPAAYSDEHRPPCDQGEAWVSTEEGMRFEQTGEACAWCQLVTELQNHPNGSQDCVMALWLAWRGICERAGDSISTEDQFATFAGPAGHAPGGGGMADIIGATSMEGMMHDLGFDGQHSGSLADLFRI